MGMTCFLGSFAPCHHRFPHWLYPMTKKLDEQQQVETWNYHFICMNMFNIHCMNTTLGHRVQNRRFDVARRSHVFRPKKPWRRRYRLGRLLIHHLEVSSSPSKLNHHPFKLIFLRGVQYTFFHTRAHPHEIYVARNMLAVEASMAMTLNDMCFSRACRFRILLQNKKLEPSSSWTDAAVVLAMPDTFYHPVFRNLGCPCQQESFESSGILPL